MKITVPVYDEAYEHKVGKASFELGEDATILDATTVFLRALQVEGYALSAEEMREILSSVENVLKERQWRIFHHTHTISD